MNKDGYSIDVKNNDNRLEYVCHAYIVLAFRVSKAFKDNPLGLRTKRYIKKND